MLGFLVHMPHQSNFMFLICGTFPAQRLFHFLQFLSVHCFQVIFVQDNFVLFITIFVSIKHTYFLFMGIPSFTFPCIHNILGASFLSLDNVVQDVIQGVGFPIYLWLVSTPSPSFHIICKYQYATSNTKKSVKSLLIKGGRDLIRRPIYSNRFSKLYPFKMADICLCTALPGVDAALQHLAHQVSLPF